MSQRDRDQVIVLLALLGLVGVAVLLTARSGPAAPAPARAAALRPARATAVADDGSFYRNSEVYELQRDPAGNLTRLAVTRNARVVATIPRGIT